MLGVVVSDAEVGDSVLLVAESLMTVDLHRVRFSWTKTMQPVVSLIGRCCG